MPNVGIFWRIQTSATAPVLLVDFVPVENAEPYGDFLIHGGHYEFWSRASKLNVPELRNRGLPEAVKWSEYEEWPRGRVVFHVPTKHFILYADRKLQSARTISLIVERFGLPKNRVNVRGDAHYTSVRF
jgi:hypothetical protein